MSGNSARIRWEASGDQQVNAVHKGIAKGIRGIADEERAAARAAKDRVRAQRGGGSGGGGGGSTSPDTGDYLKMLGRSGVGGGIFSRFGGALHADDMGLLKVGLSAAAAGVALRALTAASDRAVQAASDRTQVEITLRQAAKASVKSADATAVSTYRSNEGSLKSIAGVGGDDLVAKAVQFGRANGPEGVQAFGTLAKSGKANASTLAAIQAAAGTGQISIDKAAEVAASGKVRLVGSTNDVAAAILSEANDQPTSAGDVDRMRASFGGSKFGQRVGTFDRNEGETTAQGIARFQNSGSITDNQHEQQWRLSHPEWAAQDDVKEKLYEQMEVLAAGSRAEWAMVGLLKDIGSILGLSQGSAGTQLNQAGAAAAGAEN